MPINHELASGQENAKVEEIVKRLVECKDFRSLIEGGKTTDGKDYCVVGDSLGWTDADRDRCTAEWGEYRPVEEIRDFKSVCIYIVYM